MIAAASYVGFLAVAGAWGPLFVFVLLSASLLLIHRTGAHSSSPAVEERTAAPASAPPQALSASELIEEALGLVRRASDAAEAALWAVDAEHDEAQRIGWAGRATLERGADRVGLEGHPFAWAALEQVHVRLERGQKALPSPWANEMLLVPLPDGKRLLTLAYPGIVPPEAESSALSGGRHLGELLSLLRLRGSADQLRNRFDALVHAVEILPRELQLERLARRFCEGVVRGTRADGALLLGIDREGRAEVLYCTDESVVPAGTRVDGEGSRLALAAKHKTPLHYPDLRRERESVPLCAAGESWATQPRSALIIPVETGERCVGAVLAWHHLPGFLGEAEREFLQLFASVGAAPLQSARKYEALDRRASTDALTGLPNRASFDVQLSVLTHHFTRYGRPFGVVILDIDHFKGFNDTWGHAAGDHVLQHVGDLLRSTTREVDFPARLGGEEFVILLPESNLRESADAAERVRASIEKHPVHWNGRPLRVTASFGVAASPDTSSVPSELLDLADSALYRSKDDGRNRVTSATRVDIAGT